MSEITKYEGAALAGASADELRAELGRAIGITARAIQYVATIWAELERRGEDLSDVRFALRDYMRDVAEGRLLPEAVANLAGRRRTLAAVATLPVDEQRRLIDGAPVELARPDGGAERKTIADMTLAEVSLVIRDGAVRPVEAQRLALSRRRPKPRRGRPPRIIVDKETATVRIGTHTVEVEGVISALAAAGYLGDQSDG